VTAANLGDSRITHPLAARVQLVAVRRSPFAVRRPPLEGLFTVASSGASWQSRATGFQALQVERLNSRVAHEERGYCDVVPMWIRP